MIDRLLTVLKEKSSKLNFWYIFVAIYLVFLAQSYWSAQSKIKPIPYSEFHQLLEDKKINAVVLKGDTILAELVKSDSEQKYVNTNRVDYDVAQDLQKYGVKFESELENTFLKNILSWVFPIMIFFLLWNWLAKKAMRRMGGDAKRLYGCREKQGQDLCRNRYQSYFQ
jgi:cell division protease FtsH